MQYSEMFQKYKKICVLGLSPDPSKTSHQIAKKMQRFGFDLVGVYPSAPFVSNIPMYDSLKDVPQEYRKFVNVFRKSEAILQVVDEILQIGDTEVLWLQLGISHEKAEKKARDAGMEVVADRCIYIEYLDSH